MKKFLKPKYICIAIVILLIIAALVNRGLSSVNKEGVSIVAGGKTYTVTYTELSKGKFSGTLVNGKGEASDHEYVGLALNEVLSKKGVKISDSNVITVTAADNYEAEVSGKEVLEGTKIYIAIEADGKMIEGIDAGKQGAQLIVFGDTNSKRCVRYLNTLTVK